MSQPPADEPWGARVVQGIDSGPGLLVELDAPCTPTGSPDYTLLVIVPLAHPLLASAEADKWWLTLVVCAYLTHIGPGANRATVGELVYDETGAGRVTQQTIAEGVARRFGSDTAPLGTVKRLLSTWCAPHNPAW